MLFDDVDESGENRQPAGLPVGQLFREVNGEIRELAGRFGDDEVGMFVCECDDSRCWAAVPLTMSEYDAARHSTPSAALVAHGHADRTLEESPA